jgi:hypothetical protein
MSLERLAGRQMQDDPSGDLPLMQRAGPDSAIVAWREDSAVTRQEAYFWSDFSYAITQMDPAFIEARWAAVSEPIRFNLDANQGARMLLPHLAVMKRLMFKCNAAMVVDLHNQDRAAAWTNLLASTHLVTAWEPAPSDICQAVRFALMTMAYESTWEALQAGGWSDEQLAKLQRDWESVDFFAHLPETRAFTRAATAAECESMRKDMAELFHVGEIFKEMAKAPRESPQMLRMVWSQWRYLNGGVYDDEKSLLLFYRDRELEMQKAVKAPSWLAMKSMPGATNQPVFTSKYRSSMAAMLNMRQMNSIFAGRGLLERAAQVEARRRLIITAIALERFRVRHGHYPVTLGAVVPEFLKQPPIDFMDGQPLRYRLGEDGRFVLYSTGVDCVDDGGVMAETPAARARAALPRPSPMGAQETGDMVWPRAATASEIAILHEQEMQARRQEAEFRQRTDSEEYWNTTATRQASADSSRITPEAEINANSLNGQRVSDILRNENASGTNTLAEMLTLHPVITGAEPETITFEAPIKFDALTNVGALSLLIDLNKADALEEAEGNAAQVRISRAANGNCLLAWHTIFETPGRHTLQMGLYLVSGNWRKVIAGPIAVMDVTNLCQFSESSANFDSAMGAWLFAKVPESKVEYSMDMFLPGGKRVKTIRGKTSNGEIEIFWDLVGEDGKRLGEHSFSTVFRVTLPDSGRTQTLKGP